MVLRWSNWPLRAQLAALCALILLIVNVTLGLGLRAAVRAVLIERTAAQLQQQVASLLAAELSVPPPFRSNAFPPGNRLRSAPHQPERLGRALAEAGLLAQIYAPDGRISVAAAPLPRLTPAQLAQAFDAPLTFIAPSDEEEAPLVVVALPWHENGALLGVIQVATSLGPVDALLQDINARLWTGILLAAVAAALGCWSAGYLVFQPLQRMLLISRQVAQGDLQARSGLRSANEIGRLSQAFDSMLDHLAATLAAQRRFVADAAHELRTPLTALGNALELLLLGAITEPAAQRHALQRCYALLERLSRLTQHLLLLSRLDAQVPLPRAPVDLCALVREAAADLEPLLATHQVQLEIPDQAEVMGHADQLRQVIFNLLDNARQYTPPGGRILVSIAAEQDNARLSISDTGVGIPPAELPYVWERFRRVDHDRARHRGGAGLGLAIVKASVEAHGGHVTIRSRPGHGTTVVCILPRRLPTLTETRPRALVRHATS